VPRGARRCAFPHPSPTAARIVGAARRTRSRCGNARCAARRHAYELLEHLAKVCPLRSRSLPHSARSTDRAGHRAHRLAMTGVIGKWPQPGEAAQRFAP
jgi:hypothetical protein